MTRQIVHLNLDADNKIIGDRYYLHHLVAQSSYSKIFLASDLVLNDRRCAVKQLYPSYCPVELRSKIEAAFLHEAKVLKKLTQKHPQICQFYNCFTSFGYQYIVQEWVEGDTLAARLRQSKLPESEIKSILLDTLSVLEYVHSQGIIHNDIKPENIILRLQDKLPVLIDFGVSREVNTNYGQNIVGTPGYMSLEQAMGKATFNNDLYSLGLTAIHLLTGKSPLLIDFNSGKSNFWQQEKTAFNPKLVAVIDRAISPQGDRRFNSAKEMHTALQSVEAISLSTSINGDRAKSTLGNSILTLLLAILGMGFYLSYLSTLQPYSQPDHATTNVRNSQQTERLISDSISVDDLPKPKILETVTNPLQDVIFVPGTDQRQILEQLGEPVWRKPGFWANSIAWSYENIVSEGFDIGYIFDRQTHLLRQVEIAVPPTTELGIVQSAMNSFLAAEQSTVDIEQGLQAVYQRQQKNYNFTVGNLQGIIQRNHQDRIYLAVWAADFH